MDNELSNDVVGSSSRAPRPRDEGGVLAEYGLILVLVAVVVVSAVILIGPKVANFFTSAGNGF